MSDAVDPKRCPLCGVDNACGSEASASSCWCWDMEIPADVLAKVPEAAQGRACVCRACATGKTHPDLMQKQIDELTRR